MQIETRITKLTVLPVGADLFCETAFNVEIDDEAAGEYVKVTSNLEFGKDDCGVIRIDPEEWPALKAAIEQMVKECRKYN